MIRLTWAFDVAHTFDPILTCIGNIGPVRTQNMDVDEDTDQQKDVLPHSMRQEGHLLVAFICAQVV